MYFFKFKFYDDTWGYKQISMGEVVYTLSLSYLYYSYPLFGIEGRTSLFTNNDINDKNKTHTFYQIGFILFKI